MIQAWANRLSLNFILKTLIFTVLCMSNVYYETAESQKGFQSYNGLCLHIVALSVNSSREWLQGPEAALYGDSTGYHVPVEIECSRGRWLLAKSSAQSNQSCLDQLRLESGTRWLNYFLFKKIGQQCSVIGLCIKICNDEVRKPKVRLKPKEAPVSEDLE